MNYEYQHLIPEDFHTSSKVLVYQSSRLLVSGETSQLQDKLCEFIASWESHGTPVKGYATVLFGQFIVFMADDSDSKICGRSIDSVARFVLEIENQFSISLLDRQTLAFLVKDKVLLLPLSQLQYSIDNNFITAESLYFNNLVTDKKSFLTSWIIPLKESWLATRIASLLRV